MGYRDGRAEMPETVATRSSHADLLRRRRVRALLLFAASFSVWQLGGLLVDSTEGSAAAVLRVVSLLGGLVVAVACIRIVLLRRALAGQPDLLRAVEDERVAQHRAHSFTVGFWAVLIVQVAFIAAQSLGVALAGGALARFTIVIAIASTAGSFAFQERT